MKFQGFVGPTYSLKSVNVDCQRCVNLYPEIVESGTGKGGDLSFLKSTPGLIQLITAGSGPVRCIVSDPQGRVLVAIGNKMYKLTYASGVWSSLLLGTLATSTGIIRFASNAVNTDTATVFVDGNTNYLFLYTLGVEYFGDFGSFGYPGVPGATHVSFIDGYFIFNNINTNQFYVSDYAGFSVNPLSFASAEGDPDNIMGLISNHRDLWLFNEKTTEVWTNTGNADFPFERVSGGFIEKGCVARYSIAKIEGYVFWLGRDETGQGVVFIANGLVPQRISTHAVEQAIQSYSDMALATAFTYQKGGHLFYVLNFTEATWVYDFAAKQWHERAYTNNGTLERHRADVCAFLPNYQIHMVGDYSNNKIYQFDDLTYSDAGDAITRMRITPHVSNELKRVFCSSMQIDMETGVGLDGIAQGTNPKAMLRFSDDGGHTWSNELWTDIGKIGKFGSRAIWRRLGVFRDRVFKLVITDPVPVTILSAELEVDPGAS